jgi:hypothetical protein
MSDRVPTLADVCSAIAEGRLAVASDGQAYLVNAFELRRYFNRCRSLPPISLLDTLSSAYSDTGRDWSVHDLCGFGL